MIPKDTETNASIKTILKNLTLADFRNFGIQHIAYIRPVMDQSRIVYSIYAADGSRLSIMNTLQEAAVAARMNDLEPVTVH
jgi:hypothetical protein